MQRASADASEAPAARRGANDVFDMNPSYPRGRSHASARASLAPIVAAAPLPFGGSTCSPSTRRTPMFDQLLGNFMGSQHAQDATQALIQRGYSPQDAQALIAQSLPAAAQAMHG